MVSKSNRIHLWWTRLKPPEYTIIYCQPWNPWQLRWAVDSPYKVLSLSGGTNSYIRGREDLVNERQSMLVLWWSGARLKGGAISWLTQVTCEHYSSISELIPGSSWSHSQSIILSKRSSWLHIYYFVEALWDILSNRIYGIRTPQALCIPLTMQDDNLVKFYSGELVTV